MTTCLSSLSRVSGLVALVATIFVAVGVARGDSTSGGDACVGTVNEVYDIATSSWKPDPTQPVLCDGECADPEYFKCLLGETSGVVIPPGQPNAGSILVKRVCMCVYEADPGLYPSRWDTVQGGGLGCQPVAELIIDPSGLNDPYYRATGCDGACIGPSLDCERVTEEETLLTRKSKCYCQ
ncbi:MAG: hypothetical protein KDB73_11375 [Planctomycetes bacterium]|nr:hypothetical protein [Planctomycetota bacterium]